MWLSKSKKLIGSLVVLAIILIAGCADDPENQAAKQLRERTDNALEIVDLKGDFEKARKELKKAITQSSLQGPVAEPAILTCGDFAVDHAQYFQSEAVKYTGPIHAALDEISITAHKLIYLQIEQEQLDSSLVVTDQQIEQLDMLVYGDEQNPGIQKKLTIAEEKLNQLQEEYAGFVEQEQHARQAAEEIEHQAEERFRRAQTSSGDEKLRLQQEGYNLLLTKKKHFVRGQESLDKIKNLESEIAIIEPTVEKLKADLSRLQQQKDDIENSARRSNFKAQLRDTREQIEEKESWITKLISSLQQVQEERNKVLGEMTSLLGEAQKDYKKIRSQSARDIAAVGLADCYFMEASSQAGNMEFHRNLSLRLQSIASGVEGRTADALNGIASQFSGVGSDFAKKAMETFDIATDAYSKLQERLGRGKDELSCNVIKNYMLTLYAKITLAEQLDEYDIVDKTLAQADELMEKARSCDPDFANSITSRLFSGDIERIPLMAVDVTTYYSQLKEQFQEWKGLEGDDREKEIRRLMQLLEEMGEPKDPEEFNRIIDPEKEQLEAALSEIIKDKEQEGL